jgi:hypothetical protein
VSTAASLYYGWLPDLTLGEFLEHQRRAVARLRLVLLSSIDSDSAVSEMPWVRRHLDRDAAWAISTDPLVISGDRLLAAAQEDNIFNGFDEIWVPKHLPVSAPPVEANLVAPRMFGVSLPDEVRDWMEKSGWRLGLGDGDGLNYVVSDLPLARQLDLPITDR